MYFFPTQYLEIDVIEIITIAVPAGGIIVVIVIVIICFLQRNKTMKSNDRRVSNKTLQHIHVLF